MVVASSERAYTLLKRQFKDRTVDKRYHTLVQGHPDPMSGTSTHRSDRHPTTTTSGRSRRAASRHVTHYDPVEAFRAAPCST